MSKQKCYTSHYSIQINIFLAKTVQCNAVQCVLYYKRKKTLLLGTSLYKPYNSEVHLLNQHYLHIGTAVFCNLKSKYINIIILMQMYLRSVKVKVNVKFEVRVRVKVNVVELTATAQ